MSRILLAAALVQLVALPAVAGPIVSEVRNGNTYSVLDPEAQLLWLAPRWSNGLTATEAVARFDGFHLATLAELSSMFSAAGLPAVAPDSAVGVDQQLAGTFRQLWTDSSNVTGFFDSGIPGRVGDAGLSEGNSLAIATNVATVSDVPRIEGHWLVRPVPEPAGLILLAVGLLLCVFSGRYWT